MNFFLGVGFVFKFTQYRFFVNVSKPRPNDHPLLIIFILGGVTSSEVKTIKETVAVYSANTQVGISCFSLLILLMHH